MNQYTQEEIDKASKEISQMEHYEMCRLWRFGGKDIYFRKDLPTSEAFKDRLFNHYGGFTTEISNQTKLIGNGIKDSI